MTYFQESGSRVVALNSQLSAQRGRHISEFAYLELDADIAQLAADL